MRRETAKSLPVMGENAACTPCHAPLDVPQKVDQKGAIESFSTGVSVSCTRTWSIARDDQLNLHMSHEGTHKLPSCMHSPSICVLHGDQRFIEELPR